MVKSHKSLNLFEFQQRSTSDNQCRAYLAAEKWKNGKMFTLVPSADIRIIVKAIRFILDSVRDANIRITRLRARFFIK